MRQPFFVATAASVGHFLKATADSLCGADRALITLT